MGTIIDYEVAGEPLLATGTPNVTDMTFRQLRQLTRLVGLHVAAAGGVDGFDHLKVTDGGAGAVNAAAGYVFVPGTTVTGPDGQHCYGVPLPTARTLSGIPTPAGATRRDLVVMRVYDEGDAPGAGIAAESRLQYIVNASETTAAEATPANSYKIAEVDVTTGGAKTIRDFRQTIPIPGRQLIGGFAKITGLSSGGGDKVTLPNVAGNSVTPVELVAYAPWKRTDGGAGVTVYSQLRDAAGGAGTSYGQEETTSPAAGYHLPAQVRGIVPAWSGLKSLYWHVNNTGGTPTIGAGTTIPAVLIARWAGEHAT